MFPIGLITSVWYIFISKYLRTLNSKTLRENLTRLFYEKLLENIYKYNSKKSHFICMSKICLYSIINMTYNYENKYQKNWWTSTLTLKVSVPPQTLLTLVLISSYMSSIIFTNTFLQSLS